MNFDLWWILTYRYISGEKNNNISHPLASNPFQKFKTNDLDSHNNKFISHVPHLLMYFFLTLIVKPLHIMPKSNKCPHLLSALTLVPKCTYASLSNVGFDPPKWCHRSWLRASNPKNLFRESPCCSEANCNHPT